MPLNKYFKGDGEAVMRAFKKHYGGEKGKRVFYATATKQGQAPPRQRRRRKRNRGGTDGRSNHPSPAH